MPTAAEERWTSIIEVSRRIQATLDDAQSELDTLLYNIDAAYESAYLDGHLEHGDTGLARFQRGR